MNKKIWFTISIMMLMMIPMVQTTADDTEEEFVLDVHNLYTFFTLPVDGYTAHSLMTATPGFNVILYYDTSISDLEMLSEYDYSVDFELEAGVGYILASPEYEGPVTLSGVPIENATVTLEKGWNLLGYIKDEPATLESIYNSIPHCNIVLKWDYSKEDFILYVPGVPSEFGDVEVNKGEAFLVAVTQESVWVQ